jgi:hypothetical protein
VYSIYRIALIRGKNFDIYEVKRPKLDERMMMRFREDASQYMDKVSNALTTCMLTRLSTEPCHHHPCHDRRHDSPNYEKR